MDRDKAPIAQAFVDSMIQQCRDAMVKIANEKAHWMSCKDGSYEYALSEAGYYQLQDVLDGLLILSK